LAVNRKSPILASAASRIVWQANKSSPRVDGPQLLHALTKVQKPPLDGGALAVLLLFGFRLGLRFPQPLARFGAHSGISGTAMVITHAPLSRDFHSGVNGLIVSFLDLNPRLQTGRSFSRFFVHRLTP
jgi:hypothetical protein